MLITCPECTTRYNLTAAQIGPEGRTLKCAKCGHAWFVPPETPPDEPDLDIPPPLPPENTVGLDEMAFVGTQPAWWRKFGASLTLWLVVLTVALAIALAAALWLLMSPEPAPDTSHGSAPLTDAQPDNLSLSNLTREIQEDGALVILKFSGTVTNNGSTTQTLPELRLQLLDVKGIELDFWPADVAKPVLEAGESARWTARFLNPPLERIATWRAFFKTGTLAPLLPAKVEETSPTEPATEATSADISTTTP
ncbi:MAG: MJ0042-type zinc finger domain-containing protein [Alphaproteobacteria bacterium]